MRTLRSVVGLVAAAMLVATMGVVGVASAEPTVPDAPGTPEVPDVPEPASLTITTIAETWYQLTGVNTCGLPAGCLPASVPSAPKLPAATGAATLPSASAYPADTLHVGFVGAVETARTYLKLDLSSLPDGAQVSEGELTLPVDSRPTAGTLKPEDAQMKACLATSGFPNQAGGSLAPPPKIDCGISSPLSYGAGQFRVDLAPFMEAWADGAENFGIAITPFRVPDPTKPFQVAFPASSATNLPHIGGLLKYDLAAATDDAIVDDGAATPAAGPGFTWVGATTKKATNSHKASGAVGSSSAAPLTNTVATPGTPPSDWTPQIITILVALAAMGGIYEVTRRRMRRYAF